jgi:hypothetical protein
LSTPRDERDSNSQRLVVKGISAISWLAVLLVEETGIPWENHQPVASHWLTLSFIMLYTSPCPRFKIFIIHHKYYNNEHKILSICIHHELWKYSPNSDFVDLSVLGLRSHSTYSDWHHYSFDKTEYSYYSPSHLYHLI